MLRSFKSQIRKIVPENFLLFYHRVKAFLAVIIYKNPSKKLKVIGITGTKGKSTTANFVWSVLQAGGIKTGLIGTANIRFGEKEEKNFFHMTMPSPFVLQKFYKQMVDEGCKALVMEVTSEGIKQFRHKGTSFDIGVFTNLSPEHLPSHNNSFDEYKKTKKKFFRYFIRSNKKIFVNADDPHSDFFLDVEGVEKITTSLENGDELCFEPEDKDNTKYKTQNREKIIQHSPLKTEHYKARIISISENSTKFSVADEEYEIFIGGSKNVENALLAVAIGKQMGISAQKIQQGFTNLKTIPGRMEKIDQGQNFSVFVDYAHEEKSMDFLMETGKKIKDEKLKNNHPLRQLGSQDYKAEGVNNTPPSTRRANPRTIVLLGAEGGGRDPAKRSKMGKVVGEKADIVIVSNVDPYDDDPTEICEDIAQAAEKEGKKRGDNLFIIEDRKKGIEKCFSLASSGDTVFITGKGSEQSMVIGTEVIKWDDREVVKQILNKI